MVRTVANTFEYAMDEVGLTAPSTTTPAFAVKLVSREYSTALPADSVIGFISSTSRSACCGGPAMPPACTVTPVFNSGLAFCSMRKSRNEDWYEDFDCGCPD